MQLAQQGRDASQRLASPRLPGMEKSCANGPLLYNQQAFSWNTPVRSALHTSRDSVAKADRSGRVTKAPLAGRLSS